MKFGIFGINTGLPAADPAAAARAAVVAERAGWESLWAAEHYVLPDRTEWTDQAADEKADDAGHVLRRQSGSNAFDPAHPHLDPFVSLAHVAAHTSTILLATGVVVLPLHQPAMLAKKVTSVANISGGRLLFGVGAGYLAPEFAAFGVPTAGRGARMDELLDVLALLWAGTPVNHRGTHFTVEGVRQEPHPDVPVPIVVGGHSEAAIRRAARVGSGWFGWDLTPALAAPLVKRLDQEAERIGRTTPLEITVNPAHGAAVTPELVAEFESIGVHRLSILPPLQVRNGSSEGYIEYVRTSLPGPVRG